MVRASFSPWPLALFAVACGSSDPAASPPAAPELLGAVEVRLYPEQPMVADVVVPVAEGIDVGVAVPADAGVRVAAPVRDGERVTVRLRGLAPDADHRAAVTLTRGGGTAAHEAPFRTLAPLTGFVPSFPVTGAEAASAELRLFDRETTPDPRTAGVFVVDREGVTRWYMSRNSSRPDEPYPVEKAPIPAVLLPDGTLAFTQDHDVWRIDELGAVVTHLTADQLGVPSLHHDVHPMENGHLLALAYEFRDVPVPETTDVVAVCGDVVIEFDWEGTVHWRWSAFDHLDPTRFRDGLNIVVPDRTRPGEGGLDWTHANSVVHRASDDTVLVSLRHQDWVLNIDRATGDLLWRLGPEGDLALEPSATFYHQHAAHWLPDGRLALYDNGLGNPGNPTGWQSRGLILTVDEGAGAAAWAWESYGVGYQSGIAGGISPLADGGFLLTDALVFVAGQTPPNHAVLREVSAAGVDEWTLDGGQGWLVYRATAVDRLPGEAAPAP